MELIYQCCYTNATQAVGGQMTSGWRTVSVSPDIPGDAYDACVKLQNANASLCTSAVDERGNVLALYELCGTGGYLYVIRTQFGLSDRLGRPNMFSHAIIFHLQNNANLLWNPNFYLSLDSSAFRTAENSPAWEGRPPYAPSAVSYTLEDAMRDAGLGQDREKYAVLVRCIYAQVSQKGGTPLYLQYDGTKRQLKGLAYCICAGVPRHILKKISMASCPTANDRGKDVVFSQNACKKERYLIPRTGENTVLIPRIERKIERYGYVDYAVRNLPLEQIPQFFDRLETIAGSMGDPSASNQQILKLAFQLSENQDDSGFTDMELESNFSDALHLPISGNKIVELVLTRILQEINKRSLSLSPENASLLKDWMAGAKSEALKEAGRSYLRKRKPEE